MLGEDAGTTQPIDALTFWDLFKECVEITYLTAPAERLGTVKEAMIARFGTINSPTWERVENTVLRVVCWMEEFKGH